jgi:hypothetical protein
MCWPCVDSAFSQENKTSPGKKLAVGANRAKFFVEPISCLADKLLDSIRRLFHLQRTNRDGADQTLEGFVGFSV